MDNPIDSSSAKVPPNVLDCTRRNLPSNVFGSKSTSALNQLVARKPPVRWKIRPALHSVLNSCKGKGSKTRNSTYGVVLNLGHLHVARFWLDEMQPLPFRKMRVHLSRLRIQFARKRQTHTERSDRALFRSSLRNLPSNPRAPRQ